MGFKVGNVACCSNGVLEWRKLASSARGTFQFMGRCERVCVFDGGHHADKANFQLAQLMWRGPKHVTGPCYNVEMLFNL
ncbi:hypothetical protein Pint_29396 [Pistacia integerrima]|uniref:Uncharacterized protein n=1 Tax=Pistacia integerrima TaxID=434235 RepID=A0ACC0WXB9_9ROSI|nr:hypothetical protein Pint_29396 [Pistacia integerrima]